MRTNFFTRAIVVGACAFALSATAEEGMWTFDNLPAKQLKAKYNFTADQAWLDHVRLSCVRLNDGGSGSFVSPDGLLLTNHHVARGQLQKSSTAEHNYIRDGFYAKTQADELKSPDLEINVLESMQNVTDKVQGSVKAGMSDADALKARRAAIAQMESDNEKSTGLKSEVVSLYQGGEYWLYGYHKYTDVRIVFAPEEQTAFFGGDPDNFTYPRYDLDMALFRVYENGQPIHPKNYLKWSANGAKAGELVFVTGHPGSTQRDDTMNQLELERNTIEPAVLDLLRHRIEVLQQFSAQGPEQARIAGTQIFGLQNSLKVYVGRQEALADKNVLAKKEADEKDFRGKVNANPEWKAKYGNAWAEIDAADAKQAEMFKKLVFRRMDSTLAGYASLLVQYVVETKKPDADRLPGFHDAELASLKFRLASKAPVYPDFETARMTGSLEESQKMLGANDPWLKEVLAGRTPAEAAKYYIGGSKLGDPAVRQQLADGGQAAIDASTDPLIVTARKVDPMGRAMTKIVDAEISGPLTKAGEKIGEARFAVYGKNTYPDATFTLRLSYGTVDGYPMNGTIAPPFTTMYGLYDRSDSFSDKPPFDLPQRWVDGQKNLTLSTPMDFVSTNDIIGGNSGSPVINRNAEVVGLIFDGNIESLAGDFVYDGSRNRAVSVHSAAMMEALRKLYGASALADEITGGKP